MNKASDEGAYITGVEMEKIEEMSIVTGSANANIKKYKKKPPLY